MQQTAYIALGSNLDSEFGRPEENLQLAVRRVAALGRLQAISSFYRTDPVGDHNQAPFLNAALALATELPPVELLHQMLSIENEFGRRRDPARPKGPRTLDLDLLLVDNLVLSEPELTLPHPALASRRFALVPLAEIAPQLRHPLLGLTIADLLRRLPDEGENRICAVRKIAREK